MTKDFSELEGKLLASNQTKRIVVVMASDASTRGAVARALDAGFATVTFIGATDVVKADPAISKHQSRVSYIEAESADDAAAKAVAMCRRGEADVLMKGMINTDNLLRAVLNKECGILSQGEVLTHVSIASIPAYHKLLLFSDAAVIPYPTNSQRECQLRYLLKLARDMGFVCPKVALTHCSEKVDERHFPFTDNYTTLCENARAGVYGECIVDGPLDVKTSCDKAALDKKGISSPLNGDADALIFPDIEAANTFYKTITLFAAATLAGMLCGCSVPVVLPSRGDNVESKYNSLVVASMCNNESTDQ